MFKDVSYIVRKDHDGLTIKEILKSFYVGKAKIEEIRVNHLAYLNNKEVSIETVVHQGDNLEFYSLNRNEYVPIYNDIDILYEDDSLLIVNKPKGLLVHDDGTNADNLCSRIQYYFLSNNINHEVYIVHRLDYLTTGIIIFAKDFLSQSLLNHELDTHEITRLYLALVEGKLTKKEGVIDLPIGKDRHNAKKYRVSYSPKAKEAKTTYKVEKILKNKTLVKLKLFTGRTHQIRVHMASINHPLIDDKLYNPHAKNDNFYLHSSELILKHPLTNKEIHIECELPISFKREMEK